MDGKFWFGMTLEIQDGNGNPPTETKLYRCAKGKEACFNEGGGVIVQVGDFGLHGVSSREPYVDDIRLDDRYVLSPGVYTISAKRLLYVQQEDPCWVYVSNPAYRFCHLESNLNLYNLPADEVVIQSNPVTLFVVPDQ